MANNNYQSNNQGQDNGEARAARRDMNTFLCRCRLAADATYRPGGVDENGGQAESVLFFRLACNDGYLRRDKTNAVSYISCRLRGKRADALHQYLVKGTRVTMEARLVTWSNKDAQGQYEDHYILDVDELWFESQNQAPQQYGQPAMQNQQMPAATQQYGQPMMNQPVVQNQQMPNQVAATQQQMPAQAPQQYAQPMMNQPVMQNQAPAAQQQMPNQQMPVQAPQQYAPQPAMQNQAPAQQAAPQQPMMGQAPVPAAPSPFAFEENPFENPMFSVGN